MSLISAAQNPSPLGRIIKELALANVLSTDRGKLTLDLYQLLYDNPDKIEILNDLNRLLLNLPLTPIDDPFKTGEFIEDRISSRCEYIRYDAKKGKWYDIRYPSKFSQFIIKHLPLQIRKILPNFILVSIYTTRRYIDFPYEP